LFTVKKVEFAAVILDPAETRPFTTTNFQEIIETAHRHGALVIFDEVKTGFRTALGGVQALFGVMPDLTAISKGMANGYPIAAVVGLSQHMDRMKDIFVSGTFSVESMSMAASLATIQELKEKNVPDHLNRIGQRFIDGLNEICSIRGIEGPLAYADPVPSMPRFKWDPYTEDHSNPAHIFFFSQCMRYGLFFSHWHVSFINYSHQEKDIDEALDLCDFIMAKTKREFNL
jgi:glutamate-1-semialdehyde 2,1-aminomutase